MKLTFSLLFLGLAYIISAQHREFKRTHEVGFGLGATNYTGDLAEYMKFQHTKPAGNIFYRYNFPNEVSVIRTNFLIAGLGANEAIEKEPFKALRGNQFKGTLIEVAGIYEYDFFDFRDIDGKYYMSPFLFGGLGIGTLVGSNNTTFLNVPFGTGIKFRMSGGWNFGMEFGARKNFSDLLDGVTSSQLLGTSVGTDWYYHLGLNLSYTFYSLICPEDVKFK